MFPSVSPCSVELYQSTACICGIVDKPCCLLTLMNTGKIIYFCLVGFADCKPKITIDTWISWTFKTEIDLCGYIAIACKSGNGRIHTSYNQAVAATGRLSSTNPNLTPASWHLSLSSVQPLGIYSSVPINVQNFSLIKQVCTKTWQLCTFPTTPAYWRATPTDLFPF